MKHTETKADIFRAIMIEKEGGVYLDIDARPLFALKNIFYTSDTFLTSDSLDKNALNPIILAASPNHTIMTKTVELMINRGMSDEYSYWGTSICLKLPKLFWPYVKKHCTLQGNGVFLEGNKTLRLLHEQTSLTTTNWSHPVLRHHSVSSHFSKNKKRMCGSPCPVKHSRKHT